MMHAPSCLCRHTLHCSLMTLSQAALLTCLLPRPLFPAQSRLAWVCPLALPLQKPTCLLSGKRRNKQVKLAVPVYVAVASWVFSSSCRPQGGKPQCMSEPVSLAKTTTSVSNITITTHLPVSRLSQPLGRLCNLCAHSCLVVSTLVVGCITCTSVTCMLLKYRWQCGSYGLL